jgi:hypothetical protein
MRHKGFDLARRMGAEWAYILVNANNRLIQDILRRSYPGMIATNRLLVHGIVMRRTPFGEERRRSYAIDPIDESDWPDLLEFVRDRMQANDLYPLMEASRWRQLPDSPTESYRVARDRSGRIVAALGSCDPSAAKRALILGYGRLERIALGPVNWLLSGLGIRPFPIPGGQLHLLYTLCPLARPGHEAALGQLISRLRKERRDYSAVLLAFPKGDPRNRLVRKFIHFTNVNIPLLIPLTSGTEEQLKAQSPHSFYIEYARI